MLEIFRFYIGVVIQIFNRVLNGFEIATGIGFGTFLLACGILVAFVSLIKFQYGNTSLSALRSFRNRNIDVVNSKHGRGKNKVDGYTPKHSKLSNKNK